MEPNTLLFSIGQKILAPAAAWIKRRGLQWRAGQKALRAPASANSGSLTDLVQSELHGALNRGDLPEGFPHFALKRWLEGDGNVELVTMAALARSGGNQALFEVYQRQLAEDFQRITPGAQVPSELELSRLVGYINTRLTHNPDDRARYTSSLLSRAVASDALESHQSGQTTLQQSAAVDRLTRQMEALSQGVGRNPDATKLIDDIAVKRLDILVRARHFVGFDSQTYADALAASLGSDGELAQASRRVRSQALAWCARIFSKEDSAKARRLLDQARMAEGSPIVDVVQLMIDGYSGDLAGAIAALTAMRTPLSMSAALFLQKSLVGSPGLLEWVRKAEIPPSAFDSDGKFALLGAYQEREEWDESLAIARALDQADLRNTPVLHVLAANALLAQAAPIELRSNLLVQAPLCDAEATLSADEEAFDFRRNARTHWGEAAAAAKALGATAAAQRAEACCLWLDLTDPALAPRKRELVSRQVMEGSASTLEVAVALHLGIPCDRAAAERIIERETILSAGLSELAAMARHAFAMSEPGHAAVATYLDRYRSQISLYVESNSLEALVIRLLAASGRNEEATRRLDALIESGWDEDKDHALADAVLNRNGEESTPTSEEVRDGRTELFALRRYVIDDGVTKDEDYLTHSRDLFTRTHTVFDALFYVRALYSLGHLDELLRVADAFPTMFRSHRELLSTYSASLYRDGQLGLAGTVVSELREDRDDEPLRKLWTMINIASGNWEALIVFVEEEWGHRDQRTASQLLDIAQIAQMADSHRAKELIHLAAKRAGNDPGVLASCYMLATQAGWENSEEVSRWMQIAAQSSTPDGPIRKASMDEVLAKQPQWEKFATEVNAQLEIGGFPMSFAARAFNRSLLEIFLFPALTNPQKQDIRRRSLIYAFSGARSPIKVTASVIAMDATSLLTCALLRIMPLIASQFERIVVPHNTLHWLFEERRKVIFHQPSRIARAREISHFLARGQLRVFQSTAQPAYELSREVGSDLAAMLCEARHKNELGPGASYVVRPAPVWVAGSLMKQVSNLDAFASELRTCTALTGKLLSRGEIAESEMQEYCAYLSLHEQPWPQDVISDGSTLYLDDLAIAYLQQLHLLPRVIAAGFKVFISADAEQEAHALIEHDTLASEAQELVEGLRQQLKIGIETGRVVLDRQVTSDAMDLPSPAGSTLSVLKMTKVCDAVVIDDRFLNKLGSLDLETYSVPILTTLDVLRHLASLSVLTGSLESHLVRLRRMGFGLVPLHEEALLEQLLSSPFDGQHLHLTAELRALRDSTFLWGASNAIQVPTELSWIKTFQYSCKAALKRLWEDGIDEASTRARADWLMQFMDIRRWAHRISAAGLDVDASRLEQLYLLVMELSLITGDQGVAIRSWLDTRVIDQEKRDNPELYHRLVSLIVSGVKRASASADEDLRDAR